MQAPFQPPAGTVLSGTLELALLSGRPVLMLGGPYQVSGALDLRSAEIRERVAIRDATFADPVDFTDVRFGRSVEFSHCQFCSNFTLAGARIDGALTLTDTRIGVAGQVAAPNPTELGPAQLPPPAYCVDWIGLHVKGSLFGVGLVIGATWVIQCARVSGDCVLMGASVEGSVCARRCQVDGMVDLRPRLLPEPTGWRTARIGGHLALASARLKAGLRCDGLQVLGMLNLDGAHVTDNVNGGAHGESRSPSRYGRWKQTSVSFDGAQIEGAVAFSGAVMSGAWMLASAEISGCLRGRTLVYGPDVLLMQIGADEDGSSVWMYGATIGGWVDFSGARLAGNWWLQSATVKGDLFGRAMLVEAPAQPRSVWRAIPTIIGADENESVSVSMVGATVDREVDFVGAQLAGAWDLENASIGETLRIGRWWESHPDVLTTIGARTRETQRVSVSLKNATIGGDLLLGSVQMDGALLGERATVRGTFDLSPDPASRHGTFIGRVGDPDPPPDQVAGTGNPAPIRLAGLLDGAQRQGLDLDFRQARIGATIFPVAAVPMVLGAVRFADAEMQSLDLNFGEDVAELHRPLLVDLRRLRVGAFRLAGTLPHEENPPFLFDGLEFAELDVTGLSDPTAKAGQSPYLTFLQQMKEFKDNVYAAVEKWLRDRGDSATADKVYLAARRRELDQQLFETAQALPDFKRVAKPLRVNMPFAEADWQALPFAQRCLTRMVLALDLGRWRDWLFLTTIGYGVRIRWPILAWFVLFALSVALFWKPASVDRPALYTYAAQSGGLAKRYEWPDAEAQPTQAEWDGMATLCLALRYQVPVVPFDARSDWVPSARSVWGDGPRYDEVAGVIRVANTVLLSLILIGLTGLLKKSN